MATIKILNTVVASVGIQIHACTSASHVCYFLSV